MSDATLDRATIRTRLRENSQRDFVAAHTKTVLVTMAAVLGVADANGTKDELYDILVANANLPDQSLRGSSSIESPVATMWGLCDDAFAEYIEDPENVEKPRRKDVIEAAKAAGIAHHTARTQYQSWLTTVRDADGNIRRLADVPVEDLPRSMQPKEEAAA